MKALGSGQQEVEPALKEKEEGEEEQYLERGLAACHHVESSRPVLGPSWLGLRLGEMSVSG